MVAAQRSKSKVRLNKILVWFVSNANNHVKEILTIWFCYIDINCRFKVECTVEDLGDVFFSSMEELSDMTNMEI